MVTILTKENFTETLKEGKWVIDAWKSGCSFCDDYKPTFEEVASKMNGPSGIKFATIKADDARDFVMKYLKFKVGEHAGSPTTIFIENGEMKRRKTGALTAETLTNFVNGKFEETKPETPKNLSPEEYARVASLDQLKVAAYDAMKNRDFHQGLVNLFDTEITRRMTQK